MTAGRPLQTAEQTARGLVTRRTLGRAKRFPDWSIRPLDTGGLDERESSLAQAIDHEVTRRWLTLASVLDSCVDQPWNKLEPVVQAPLLVGAAQILLLDRLPDHAIVNEAVNWTRANHRKAAGGLVNAVLRRVIGLRGEKVDGYDPERRDHLPLSDGGAWQLAAEVFDSIPTRRLSQVTSHQQTLIDHWLTQRTWESTCELAMHSLVHPPTILNMQAHAAAGLPAEHEDLQRHDREGFGVFRGSRNRLPELLAEHPRIIVQDPAAAAAVAGTASLSPSLIIDACAGRGTKTRQLAHLHLDATIIASDRDQQRMDDLRAIASDEPRIRVVPQRKLKDYSGQADLLVLDVPCSNTAVLSRRMEAKYRFDANSLESLLTCQRQIVADSLGLLAESGTLLYSTCSVEAAENEEQARWITKWHDMRVVAMMATHPHGAPGAAPTSYTDGGFFASLRRTT